MEDWMCNPASLEEAREIVFRAIDNGATQAEVPLEEGSPSISGYTWNLLDLWGVGDGDTLSLDTEDWDGVVYTIAQVREKFPLRDEVSEPKELPLMNHNVKALQEGLMVLSCASCTCGTKSPLVKYHDHDCNYRLIDEASKSLDEVQKLINKLSKER